MAPARKSLRIIRESDGALMENWKVIKRSCENTLSLPNVVIIREISFEYRTLGATKWTS